MTNTIETLYSLPSYEEMEKIVQEAYEDAKKKVPHGRVADYIPELSKANPEHLGICIYRLDGEKLFVGDTDVRFTIQSVSKVIALAMALEIFGPSKVFSKVGAEPSGEAFNSLVDLEQNSGKPYNPLINSGSLAIYSMLINEVSFHDMLNFTKKLCTDKDITLNETVFESEMKTCSRNKSIAYLLESKGIIESDVMDTLTLYTKMCSLNVTAETLANLGRVLASDGVCAKTGERYLSSKTVRIIKTLMLTCGMYDGSGTFAVKVGIPTKSGVGGGLLAVSDKRAGIGVYGPSLDKRGNSIAGCKLLEDISMKLRLNLFYDPEWDMEDEAVKL